MQGSSLEKSSLPSRAGEQGHVSGVEESSGEEEKGEVSDNI